MPIRGVDELRAGLRNALCWRAFSTSIFGKALYNARGDVLEKAIAYYHPHPVSTPMLCHAQGLSVIQGLSWSMWIDLIGAAVNLVLEPPADAFGWGSMPAMGIEGSAWKASWRSW
ncbi:MAG: hypothetical protein IPN85_18740 [Flavobacteriales bacterium]|nr:hypothetical protein [Flavobacteriales bacterium]